MRSFQPHPAGGLSPLGMSALAALLVFAVSAAGAQVFDSGSDESDGPLDYSGQTPGTVIEFDPAAEGYDTDGDNVYHFTTITIPADVTVKLSGNSLRMKPVYWLASGAVQIDGIIDLSGQDGHPPGDRYISIPGPGGYPGGLGNLDDAGLTEPAQAGYGPGGGDPGAGAAYAQEVLGNDKTYGNTSLVPLLGGSGGGGHVSAQEGGGAGGGALLIASSASITVDGVVRADGGYGAHAGGGSGGAIHLKAPVVDGDGSFSTAGEPGDRTGSLGRIRIEAFDTPFTTITAGKSQYVTSLSPVFLPDLTPSVRITDVAGQSPPDSPTGVYLTPDVTIDASGDVDIQIAASNVPVGTVVTLMLVSPAEVTQTVDSTPLAGTFDSSTASATLTIPGGFKQIFVHALWTP